MQLMLECTIKLLLNENHGNFRFMVSSQDNQIAQWVKQIKSMVIHAHQNLLYFLELASLIADSHDTSKSSSHGSISSLS